MKLKKISINQVDYPLANLTIIIGSNGTGKTTLLNELFQQSITNTKSSYSQTVEPKWPDYFL